MLDLKSIVADPAKVQASLKKRNADKLSPVVQELVSLDEKRRSGLQEVEDLKHRRNQASQEVAKRKKEKADASEIIAEMKTVSQRIKELDGELSTVQEEIQHRLFELPNVLDADVPEGADETSNKVIRTWGEPKAFSFKAKSHFEIGEALGMMDFKKAGEVTGARFVFLKGRGAKLERALIQFMLDEHSKKGYEEMIPPFLVNRASLTGTGQLPKFEEDVFHIEKYDFFLIPTAEVPVTNYHRDEILDAKDLPQKYVAYTPCFRSEAGSYGKDTRGLKRQHQFNKVELVKFCPPETSEEELEALTADAEHILQSLNLPYRVVALCGGDVGFSSAKTYDIEVWSPWAQAFVEISSCSNFRDFQARRAGIRWRNPVSNKVEFAHTLNGSGLAVGRTLLALLENCQTESGDFETPEVLQPYLNR